MRFSIRYALLVGVMAALAPLARAAEPEALPHRSWQFQDLDLDHLRRTLPKAGASGMTRIQLSHAIVMAAEELWQGKDHERRLTVVKEAIRLAHNQGMKVDMWTHELSGVPDEQFRDPATGRPALTPELWEWVEAKYEKLFKLLPDLDGLVLTFAETAHALHKEDVVSDQTPSQRVAEMIKVIHDVCARHDKLLIIRTFVHHPDELERVHGAVKAVAGTIGDSGHLVVMSKCVPHDWTPYYPFNPVLGDVAGLPQIVEIDLGQEYTGQSEVPHCEVRYVKSVLDHARAKGVIGAVARVERYNRHAVGTPNEVNIHAFNRLLQDPNLSAEALWQDWTTRRYGKEAAPHVARALKRSYEIINLMYFPLEHWVTWHSRFTSWEAAESELRNAPNRKWIASPKQILAWHELLSPRADTLMKIDHEKILARDLVDRSLEDLDRARRQLRHEDYLSLKRSFALLREAVEAYRLQQLAFFGHRYLQARVAAGDASEKDLETMRKEIRLRLAELEMRANRIEQMHGPDVFICRPETIHDFVKQGRERVPAPEDETE